MYKTMTRISAIVPSPMKAKWFPFHCRAGVHYITYNAWLSFTAATGATEHPKEDFNAQQLRIKYVY